MMENIRNNLSIKLNEKLWNKEDKLLKSKLEKRLFYKLMDTLPSKVFEFGHYNDYNRAKKWADAGGYKILESKSF